MPSTIFRLFAAQTLFLAGWQFFNVCLFVCVCGFLCVCLCGSVGVCVCELTLAGSWRECACFGSLCIWVSVSVCVFVSGCQNLGSWLQICVWKGAGLCVGVSVCVCVCVCVTLSVCLWLCLRVNIPCVWTCVEHRHPPGPKKRRSQGQALFSTSTHRKFRYFWRCKFQFIIHVPPRAGTRICCVREPVHRERVLVPPRGSLTPACRGLEGITSYIYHYHRWRHYSLWLSQLFRYLFIF